MIDARLIATDGEFRIVKQTEGERVTYVLEKHDGFDAFGVERWKNIGENIGTTGLSRQLFNWVIKHSVACTHMKGQADAQNE